MSVLRIRAFGALLLTSVLLLAGAGPASGESATRIVRYRGYSVAIPRSWPVYDLSRDPPRCVRFDRHALYLGTPGSEQRCPAHLAGRTEAILIEPIAGTVTTRAAGGSGAAGGVRGGGLATGFVVPSAGVAVTATWAHAPAVIKRALHRSSLPAIQSGSLRHTRSLAPRQARAAAAIFTGLGFDACSAPSQRQMSAWTASPYRAAGVYIGGLNAACSQTNLSTMWVSDEIAAGWHLIPTYVGLQAPSNSCGCSAITPSQASAEGVAAANDASSNAVALGIPDGSPIYFDMEAYSRGGTNTSAVLRFLAAWTTQLHADGYASGVYASAGSGIADLVNQQGTGYAEPDDIWIAEWNGQKTTSSGYVPASDWANHQRLHQYDGGHNERYGGVTINIDGNYLDGATDGTSNGSAATEPPLPSTPPTLTLKPQPNGLTGVYASWAGAVGVTRWRVLAGLSAVPDTMMTVRQVPVHGAVTGIAIHNDAPYFEVQALGSLGQVLGTSAPRSMPPHIEIYGPDTFVPSQPGLAGMPAGCYTGQLCRIALTITSGRTVIATTGPEQIGNGNGGVVYYRLTARGRALLARAPQSRLPVGVSARDAVSGRTATATVTMIQFATGGRAPGRSLTQSPVLRIGGSIAFVSSGVVGGILVDCHGLPACQINTTLTAGGSVIAQAGPAYLGTNEFGYIIFKLTPHGTALLRRTASNQLAAQLSLNVKAGTTTATAGGRIALIRF